jgi:hypothetical protein
MSHAKLKGGEAGAEVDCIHNGKMDTGKGFSPAALVAFNVVMECLDNCLIRPLTTAVGLGVVRSGHFQLDSSK